MSESRPVEGAAESLDSSAQFWVRYTEIVWGHKKQIFRNVLIIALLTAGVSFLLPKKYIAETTVLPDLDLMSLASKFGGLQDLAASAGLNLGATSPAQYYPDVLASETVLRRVIYHTYKTQAFDSLVNMIQFYGYNDADENLNFEKCVNRLTESVITVTVDKKTFVTTIDVETTEPQLSADIANELTTELDYYERNFRKTNAAEQRQFIEQRLKEVKADLSTSEDRLMEFQEKNRTVSQSAQLSLDQSRLQRDVDLNTRLSSDLEAQFDQVKLDEIRNTPVVQVLDYARPPAQKSSPKRILLTLVFTVLGYLGVSGWYYLKSEISDQVRAYPPIEALFQFIRLLPPPSEGSSQNSDHHSAA